jgi:hypothetical protein
MIDLGRQACTAFYFTEVYTWRIYGKTNGARWLVLNRVNEITLDFKHWPYDNNNLGSTQIQLNYLPIWYMLES